MNATSCDGQTALCETGSGGTGGSSVQSPATVSGFEPGSTTRYWPLAFDSVRLFASPFPAA